MKTTKYKGLTIIHPHSGKVHRNVVARVIRNLGGLDHLKANKEYTIELSDVNYEINGIAYENY